MEAAPFFVFALLAGVIAKMADTPAEVFEIFVGLGSYSLTLLGGLFFVVFILYPLILKIFIKKFYKSNNINYRDGDRASSRTFDDFDEEEPTNESETFDMYNSPVLIKDGVLAYDESNDRTSLINDEVRVYKGGSWKDREYWLDPAQRRYYPEDMATDYIGFRCAMSRVGSKSISKKKRKN